MSKLNLLIVFMWLFTACATQPHEQFGKLKLGQEKADVLELLGSPLHSRYRRGKDEWIYVYYHKEQKLAKQLQFVKSKLVKFSDYDLDGTMEDAIKQSDSMKEMEERVEKRRKKNESGFKELKD